MNKNERIILLVLSGILCILIGIGSYNGLVVPDFYSEETVNWQAQCIGQDMINLFLIIPFLLIATVLTFSKNTYGFYLWAGTILYLIYTYLIYCFGIHFNRYFIVYCLILGLCFYLLLYFMYLQQKVLDLKVNASRVNKVIAAYFLITSVLFYMLWLSELIPAIYRNIVPQTVIDSGLFTNPVHILDLSIFLPGIFLSGVLILKRKQLGILLAPLLLTFFVLMDLTITLLTITMVKRRVESNYSVAFIMLGLAFLSLILLVLNLKNIKRK